MNGYIRDVHQAEQLLSQHWAATITHLKDKIR